MRYLRANDDGCGILDKGMMHAASLIEHDYKKAKDGKKTTMEGILNIITAYSPVDDPDDFAEKVDTLYNRVVFDYVQGSSRAKQNLYTELHGELKTYAGLAATYLFFMGLELFNWRVRQTKIANFGQTAKAFLPAQHPFRHYWEVTVDNILNKMSSPIGMQTIQADLSKETDAFDMLARPISEDQKKLREEILTQLAACPRNKVRSLEAKIFEDGVTFEQMLKRDAGTFITGGMVNTRVPLAMQFWAPSPNSNRGAKATILLLSKYFWSLPETRRLAGTSKDKVKDLQQQLQGTLAPDNNGNNGNSGNNGNNGNGGNNGNNGNNGEPEVPTPEVTAEQRQVFVDTVKRASKAVEAEIKVKHASHLNEKERLAIIEASAASLQSATDQGLTPLQALQLNNGELLTATNEASQDPTSPYFGMTQQQICSIAGVSVFGSKFMHELAAYINSTILQLTDIYRVAEAHKAGILQASTNSTSELKARLANFTAIAHSAQDDLQDLIFEAGEVFDIDQDAISSRSPGILDARPNPAISTTTIVVLVGIAAAGLWMYCHRLQAEIQTACKNLLNRTILDIESYIKLVEDADNRKAQRNALNRVYTQIETVFDSRSRTGGYDNAVCFSEDILPMYKQFLDMGLIVDGGGSVIPDQIEARLNLLKVMRDNFGGKANLREKNAQDLREADPLGHLLEEFRTLLSKTIMPVLRYAAYTALGLGVLWGSVKVYKSITNKDES